MRNDFGSVLKQANYDDAVLYDIGANRGLWTKKYNNWFPKLRFYQFEANPVHGKTNPARNYHNVLFYWRDCKMQFHSINGTGDSIYKENSKHYKDAAPITLQARSLDSYVKEHNLPLPKVIKMDVQGAELDVLAGGSNTFANVDIVLSEIPIVEYNKGAPTFEDYISAFADAGFTPAGVDQLHFAAGKYVQQDIVFLRDSLIGVYSS